MKKSLPGSWHFARPKLAEHHLLAFDLGLISATALHVRRRMGKTEFLMKDLTPAAEAAGYSVGYCNLWQEDETPAAAIARALHSCAKSKHALARLRRGLYSKVSSLKVSGKVPAMDVGAEITFSDGEIRETQVLHSAFEAFDKAKTKGLLLIDEAQLLACVGT